MPLGSQMQYVDGIRTTMPTRQQWAPQSYGPQTTGVPNVSPSLPPFLGAASGGSGRSGVFEGVNGYGTAGNNATVTQLAADNPHSLALSPVWWMVGAFVLGLWLLRETSFRDVIEAEAGGRVGAAEGRAEASA